MPTEVDQIVWFVARAFILLAYLSLAISLHTTSRSKDFNLIETEHPLRWANPSDITECGVIFKLATGENKLPYQSPWASQLIDVLLPYAPLVDLILPGHAVRTSQAQNYKKELA